MHFTLVLLKLNRRLHNLAVGPVSQFQNTCRREAWAVITGLRFQTSSRTLPTSTSHPRFDPYLWAFASAWLSHFTSFLKLVVELKWKILDENDIMAEIRLYMPLLSATNTRLSVNEDLLPQILNMRPACRFACQICQNHQKSGDSQVSYQWKIIFW